MADKPTETQMGDLLGLLFDEWATSLGVSPQAASELSMLRFIEWLETMCNTRSLPVEHLGQRPGFSTVAWETLEEARQQDKLPGLVAYHWKLLQYRHYPPLSAGFKRMVVVLAMEDDAGRVGLASVIAEYSQPNKSEAYAQQRLAVGLNDIATQLEKVTVKRFLDAGSPVSDVQLSGDCPGCQRRFQIPVFQNVVNILRQLHRQPAAPPALGAPTASAELPSRDRIFE